MRQLPEKKHCNCCPRFCTRWPLSVLLPSLNGGQESAVIPRPHFGSDAYHRINIYLIALNVILVCKSSYFCLTFFQTQAEHFLWCLWKYNLIWSWRKGSLGWLFWEQSKICRRARLTTPECLFDMRIICFCLVFKFYSSWAVLGLRCAVGYL